MILLDANVLLYAYDRESPRHDAARRWVEATLSGDEAVGLPVVTLVAFIRIATNPAIYRRPLAPGRALAIVQSWLSLPNVSVVNPSERHWSILAETVERGQARGPLVVDAHPAALAVEHGATLASTDRDFARFPGSASAIHSRSGAGGRPPWDRPGRGSSGTEPRGRAGCRVG